MIFLKKISVWYYLGFLIWGFVLMMRKLNIYIPFINNHLTDLYSVPMYCYTIELMMNNIFKYNWKPDLKFVLISTLNLSIIFEVICPLLSDKFVGDFFDSVCYLVGGLLFMGYRKYAKMLIA